MNYKDIGLVVLFLSAWIVLNRWVLPWFGVPTCMGGGCSAGCCSAVQEETAPQDQARDGSHQPAAPEGGDASR